MCYNCGCGMKDDDVGKGKVSQGGGSLTEDDLRHISEKWGISVEDTKRHIYAELRKHFEGK